MLLSSRLTVPWCRDSLRAYAQGRAVGKGRLDHRVHTQCSCTGWVTATGWQAEPVQRRQTYRVLTARSQSSLRCERLRALSLPSSFPCRLSFN
jgi:hypothetical protein